MLRLIVSRINGCLESDRFRIKLCQPSTLVLIYCSNSSSLNPINEPFLVFVDHIHKEHVEESPLFQGEEILKLNHKWQ